MEPLTFDQLPQAVSKLQDKLNDIEKLLLEDHRQSGESDQLLNVEDAAKFLNLSVPTIYSKVCRKEIPVNKQGKRLYFYKSELISWIKSGRKKTAAEIRQDAASMLASNRRKTNGY
jgi:excisionase family DNA binding protein